MVGSDVTTGDTSHSRKRDPRARTPSPGPGCAAALALTPIAALAVSSPGEAAPAQVAAAGPAVKMWAPQSVEAYLYGNRKQTRVDIDARLIAGADPFELWSNRASYDEQIKTVWRTPGGDVTLPLGSMTDFNALDDFVRVSVKNVGTGKSMKSRTKDVCLNSRGYRVRPDAPARSPYPQYCFANPYSLGSVQGIQAGWSNPLLGDAERGAPGFGSARAPTTSRSRSRRRTPTCSRSLRPTPSARSGSWSSTTTTATSTASHGHPAPHRAGRASRPLDEPTRPRAAPRSTARGRT